MTNTKRKNPIVDKLAISLVVPGMPFVGDTIDRESLGGSETAGLCMARELAKLGHSVTVFSNDPKGGVFDEVNYIPIQFMAQHTMTTPSDVVVVQRTADPFRVPLDSKLNILWCHDLAMKRNRNIVMPLLWNIDKVFLLSQFMKKQYHEVYGTQDDDIHVTRNGIDSWRVPKTIGENVRNRKRLVYAARPERGLDILVKEIFPKILRRDPEFELAIFGYNNPVDHLKDFYAELAAACQQFGGKARFMGHLTKDALYRAYSEAGVYAYPTPSRHDAWKTFSEVSCISAMEAMACGLPFVSSNRGALPETLAKGAGVLVDGDPTSDAYQDAFVDAVVGIANDPDRYEKMQAAGRKTAKRNDWSKVAKEWEKEFASLIAQRNNDRTRLAYHFYRRSDVFAARAALDGEQGPAANALRQKIGKEYAFTRNPAEFRKHYAKGGLDTNKRLKAAPDSAFDFEHTAEKRLHVLERMLAGQQDAQRILDFGCGHGWSDIYLHNKVGRKWTGIDIDKNAVKWSRHFADKFARQPKDLVFLHGDHDIDLTEIVEKDGRFDCLLISEVLEHTIDPAAVVNALEKWVRPGGTVIITTPYGPSEFGTPNWQNFRNHLWEFDIHDLMDMFGHKPERKIDCLYDHNNPVTNEPVGSYITRYRADPINLVKSYDMERKLRLQVPRQTLSAFLMGGPNIEDTLSWCLKSITDVADEIILVDTGMKERAKKICREFGVRVVKGSSPLEAGFETPRNEGLKEANMDWALWIDTDEKLLKSMYLPKYLRENRLNGYAIRQFHFSMDANIRPDMPVRVFRNRPSGGKKMRFYGMIHEHPELELNKGPGEVVILPDVGIAHMGYLSEEIRRVRFHRNYPLLQKDIQKYPERMLQKHMIMRDNMIQVMYELEQNGRQVTEAMREKARENVEIYRTHFLGKKRYMFLDTTDYYTQALRVLGQGIDVAFDLKTNREGMGDKLNGGPTYRFASKEEFQKDLEQIMSDKFDHLEGEYW